MLPLWAIIAPMFMQAMSTAASTATSISTSNANIENQNKLIKAKQEQEKALADSTKLAESNNQTNINNQFSTEYASNLNRGTSTGLLSNQMPAGTGIGVQGLNSVDYLNEDSFMAKVGGLFSRKSNAKSTVRDNNNLYFDRIEYAKCGGRFKRK